MERPRKRPNHVGYKHSYGRGLPQVAFLLHSMPTERGMPACILVTPSPRVIRMEREARLLIALAGIELDAARTEKSNLCPLREAERTRSLPYVRCPHYTYYSSLEFVRIIFVPFPRSPRLLSPPPYSLFHSGLRPARGAQGTQVGRLGK